MHAERQGAGNPAAPLPAACRPRKASKLSSLVSELQNQTPCLCVVLGQLLLCLPMCSTCTCSCEVLQGSLLLKPKL